MKKPEVPDPFHLFADEDMTEKHWRILEAAIRVFSEKGFSAARTREIAEEAGVSEGTVFNYFKTKKDLLTGLLLPLVARYFRPLLARSVENILNRRGHQPFDQVLFDIMKDRVQLIEKNWPLIKTVAAEAAFHPELLDPVRTRVTPYMIALVREWFQGEKSRGTIRDVDDTAALRVFMSMIVGYVLARKAFPEGLPLESGTVPWEADDVEIRRMLDIYLHGIARTIEPREGGGAHAPEN
ncbi:TetR/AcrR family transcriptional regulator [Kyrpidia spormannii]|uniref:TetR/AcrR family transcriptional regulator n=1 Tax=Kyrpidia spormannii TaxID=2055160 RepID=UPI0018E4D101|nr:TetR/AcrR family transcriptional regulator [Kyrpidia spormannii]